MILLFCGTKLLFMNIKKQEICANNFPSKKTIPDILAPIETASPPRRDIVDSGTALLKSENLGAPHSSVKKKDGHLCDNSLFSGNFVVFFRYSTEYHTPFLFCGTKIRRCERMPKHLLFCGWLRKPNLH